MRADHWTTMVRSRLQTYYVLPANATQLLIQSDVQKMPSWSMTESRIDTPPFLSQRRSTTKEARVEFSIFFFSQPWIRTLVLYTATDTRLSGCEEKATSFLRVQTLTQGSSSKTKLESPRIEQFLPPHSWLLTPLCTCSPIFNPAAIPLSSWCAGRLRTGRLHPLCLYSTFHDKISDSSRKILYADLFSISSQYANNSPE